MPFFPSVFLAVVLLFSPNSHGGCVLQTLKALTRDFYTSAPPDQSFKRYYLSGDPEGWKKLIEESRSQGVEEISLGGNSGNTYSISLPNGLDAVIKDFPSGEIKEFESIIAQLEKWERKGMGPKVLGVSLLPALKKSERRLVLVMENLFSSKNNLGQKILSGNGRDVRLLRGESDSAKKWLVEKMLSVLEIHPDPHPMNVIFRVTQMNASSMLSPKDSYYQEGNKIYQVFLIDPSGAEGEPDLPLFNTDISKTPRPFLQYNRAWKRKFFTSELGL